MNVAIHCNATPNEHYPLTSWVLSAMYVDAWNFNVDDANTNPSNDLNIDGPCHVGSCLA